MASVYHAEEIDPEDPVPVLECRVREAPGHPDACVVHEDVQGAVLRMDQIGQLVHGPTVGHIHLERKAAAVGCGALGCRGVDVRYENLRAAGAEDQSRLSADPVARPGDEGKRSSEHDPCLPLTPPRPVPAAVRHGQIVPLNNVNVKASGTVVNVMIVDANESSGPDGSPVPEYRIDELARMAGTTVRNVRAYQDRGLLPPSRREGRAVFYSDAHLARLRVISQLLERGYNLANIGELLGAWETGQNVGDLLGLEAVLAEPWTDETPMVVDAEELASLFGMDGTDEDLVSLAFELGFIEAAQPPVQGEPDESEASEESNGAVPEKFVVPQPRLVHVGAALVAAGIPLVAVLELGARLRDEVDRIARSFVDLAVTHVFDPVGDPIPPEEVPRLTEIVRRIRPLAKEAVDAELAEAMERHVRAELRERLERMLRDFERTRTEAS